VINIFVVIPLLTTIPILTMYCRYTFIDDNPDSYNVLPLYLYWRQSRFLQCIAVKPLLTTIPILTMYCRYTFIDENPDSYNVLSLYLYWRQSRFLQCIACCFRTRSSTLLVTNDCGEEPIWCNQTTITSFLVRVKVMV